MQIFVLMTLLFFSLSARADTWLCTHPQLCQLVEDYHRANNSELPKLEKAIATIGDPHHIEPSSKEIKNMSKAPVLLAAPMALHPWSNAIVNMRAQNKKTKTFEFKTSKNILTTYTDASLESLAHFWLYPTIHCDYWQQYHQWLNSNKEMPVCPYLEQEEKLKLAAKKVTIPIILSHDALVPLLRSWAIDAHAIRGSGHHEEPRPEQLKKLKQLLDKNAQVLWVIESKIHFPNSLKSMQRTSDRRLELDTSGDYPLVGLTPLQRLELLFAKL